MTTKYATAGLREAGHNGAQLVVRVDGALGLQIPDAILTGCRAALQRLQADQVPAIGVSSILPGDGRTSIALGVAAVQAHDYGRETILLELDLLRPSLASSLGVAATPGIIEYLRGDATLDCCLQDIGGGLSVITAGDANEFTPALVTAFANRHVLSQLDDLGDVVVADLPHLTVPGTGAATARLFRTLIMVIRSGATPMPLAQEAMKLLASPPAIILNGVESAVPRRLRRMIGATG